MTVVAGIFLTLLVLDLLFHPLDGVGGLHIQGDGLTLQTF